jgi:hypothetical protein
MPDKRKSSAAAARRRDALVADIAARIEGSTAIVNADFDAIIKLYDRKRQFRTRRARTMFNDIGDNFLNDDGEPGAGIVADLLWAKVDDELRRKAKRLADRLPVDCERGRNAGTRVIVNHPDWF